VNMSERGSPFTLVKGREENCMQFQNVNGSPFGLSIGKWQTSCLRTLYFLLTLVNLLHLHQSDERRLAEVEWTCSLQSTRRMNESLGDFDEFVFSKQLIVV